MRFRGVVSVLLAGFFILSLVWLMGCQTIQPSSASPELENASRAFRKMLAPMYLSKSMFYVAYPNGKPSDYLNFMRSTVGAAESPMGEGDFPEGMVDSRGHGPPVFPEGVSFAFDIPNPQNLGKQLVLKADDANGNIILEGYELPTDQQPALVDEVKLVKVQPSPMAKMAYQSMMEMGGTDGYADDGYGGGGFGN